MLKIVFSCPFDDNAAAVARPPLIRYIDLLRARQILPGQRFLAAHNILHAALRDQLIADCGYTDTLPVETAGLESTYGITADQVTSSASFNATVGTAFPDEIVMVEATDAAAAQDVASKLTNRLSAIADQAASYDPDSEALAKKCEVVTSGNYVGMFFSSHYDEMVSAFQNAVG